MSNLNELNFKWEKVGFLPPQELVDAREQLHHSVQLIAAAGKSLIAERPDDSHTSLHLNNDKGAFEGEAIDENSNLRVGLSPSDMILYVIQTNQDDSSTFRLQDNSLDSALSWLRSEIENRGIDASKLSLKMHYEIPPHKLARGNTLKIDNPDQFVEIWRYFSNAYNVLQATKSILPEASDVRCWPHHFDIATLIKIDKDKSAEEARSIGIGLSPGDGGYEEPYFYITPWPYPDENKSKLPTLLAGKWNTEGWVGAVLLASEITSQNNQTKTVSDFVKSGVSACAGLLNHDL